MGVSYLELTFFLSSLLIQLAPLTVAQSYFPKEVYISDRGKYTNDSTYQADLNSLLTSFSNTQVDYGFYNSSAGEVKGIGLCRWDLSPDSCRSCINSSSQDLRRLCPNYKEAILYDDLCMLRYSDRPIFGTEETSPHYAVADTQNVSDLEPFREQLQNMLLDLRGKAASGGSLRKYATGEALTTNFDTVYALVQCTPDLEDKECRDCLDGLGGLVSEFFKNKQGGQAKAPSCNFRFQTYQFYDPLYGAPPPSYINSSPPPNDAATGEGKSNRTKTVIVVVILTFVSVILVFCICICIFLRMRKPRGKDETEDEILNVESLQFNLGPIRNATDNFSDSNKLGQGGFGVVYKGTLSNGQEIAVKRLSKGSVQGELEFKNEILLMAKLRRNRIQELEFLLTQEFG